ncbi:MAG: helix-turn-helix domain-containing protein [Bdellovibrionota bacterium]
MRPGRDIAVEFNGLFVVHHNKPGSKVDRHSHKEHHLILPLRGESRIEIGAEVWTFGPGKMLYIPSNTEHEFLATNQKEGERLIALLNDSLWKKVEGSKSLPQLLPAQQLCKELLFQLVIDPENRAAKEIVLCFASVLASTIKQTGELGSSVETMQLLSKASDPRIEKVASAMRERYKESLKISELAKVSGLSERNLNRLFMQELGLSPKQALTRLRLEKARELLKTRNMSVTDTCFEVGYGSLSRFIQGYRTAFGKLPSEEA